MNRREYNGYIDPLFLKMLDDLEIFQQRPLTGDETRKLCDVKKRYEMGELSENKKMKKVSKRKP